MPPVQFASCLEIFCQSHISLAFLISSFPCKQQNMSFKRHFLLKDLVPALFFQVFTNMKVFSIFLLTNANDGDIIYPRQDVSFVSRVFRHGMMQRLISVPFLQPCRFPSLTDRARGSLQQNYKKGTMKVLHATKPQKKTFYRPDRELPKLNCPACWARLLDAGSIAVKRETRLFVYSGEEDTRFIIKCRGCGVCVGIGF